MGANAARSADLRNTPSVSGSSSALQTPGKLDMRMLEASPGHVTPSAATPLYGAPSTGSAATLTALSLAVQCAFLQHADKTAAPDGTSISLLAWLLAHHSVDVTGVHSVLGRFNEVSTGLLDTSNTLLSLVLGGSGSMGRSGFFGGMSGVGGSGMSVTQRRTFERDVALAAATEVSFCAKKFELYRIAEQHDAGLAQMCRFILSSDQSILTQEMHEYAQWFIQRGMWIYSCDLKSHLLVSHD